MDSFEMAKGQLKPESEGEKKIDGSYQVRRQPTETVTHAEIGHLVLAVRILGRHVQSCCTNDTWETVLCWLCVLPTADWLVVRGDLDIYLEKDLPSNRISSRVMSCAGCVQADGGGL